MIEAAYTSGNSQTGACAATLRGLNGLEEFWITVAATGDHHQNKRMRDVMKSRKRGKKILEE